MIKSKVYQIFLQFTNKERNRFHDFIQSKYFNSETKVTQLHSYLVSEVNKNTTKESIYEYLYPCEKFNVSNYNYLLSRLFILTRQFLEIESLKNSKDFYDVPLLAHLRANNHDRIYQIEEKKIDARVEKTTVSKSADYHNGYLYNFERMHFYAGRNRTDASYLNKMHDQLDAYYFIEKLKIACVSINQEKLYKMEVAQGFFEPLVSYIEKSKIYKGTPLLNIYFSSYKMLTENKEKYFKTLKKNFITYSFDIAEIKDAFIFALNFGIKKINEGQQFYNSETFDLYMLGIEKGIILEQKKLSPITYSNVVTIGLRLERFTEVESFIEKNKGILSGESKRSYYIFNKAKLNFEMGKYKEVTDLYNEGVIQEVLLNIQMRILQMKAFYELGEFELCQSLNQSLDKQLNRKGVLAYHKEIFKNTVKIFKRLLNVNQFEVNELIRLKEIIEGTNPLSEKPWFLQKIASFKKK